MEGVADIRANAVWVIATTFLIALILTVIHVPFDMPAEVGYLRPEWVALTLIYWVIALPHCVGLLVAWCLGLVLDVLLGDLLGQHALSLLLVAWIAQSLYQRLRMFTVWQQSAVVFGIVGLHQLINFWIERLAGQSAWSLWYLLPSVVSALLWPWIFLVLRYLRRVFNVT